VPRVEIAHTRGCEEGRPYPSCRWNLPTPREAGHTFTIWRNTMAEHRSGRPALVSLALAVANEYARQFPGETLSIGDLDAPGPRHNSHDEGIDIDLYLPGAMQVENLGQHERIENYVSLTPLQRRMHQARVLTLAKILATCTEGRVRIYYNDDDVQARFEEWYDARGWVSEYGRAMQGHNDLHRFHFHVSIPKDLAPVPMDATGEDG
jgi:murein endopeptidase